MRTERLHAHGDVRIREMAGTRTEGTNAGSNSWRRAKTVIDPYR